MRKTIGILLLASTYVLLPSCLAPMPVSVKQSDNNKDYAVAYLFEHEGCKVYRFYDNGNYVYFTNCRGDVTSIKNDSTAERVTNSVRVEYEDWGDRGK